jgi:hypothetical protein
MIMIRMDDHIFFLRTEKQTPNEYTKNDAPNASRFLPTFIFSSLSPEPVGERDPYVLLPWLS